MTNNIPHIVDSGASVKVDENQLLRQALDDLFKGLESMTAFSKAQAERIAELEAKVKGLK